MKKYRIYTDTSVIGGCFDKEFETESRRFIELVQQGKFTLLFSDVITQELENAPEVVRSLLESLAPEHIEKILITDEITELRSAYLKSNVVGGSHINDATHVACATVARADAIVSWNFKHIVRLDRIKGYNQVNLLNGYGILTIISPKEVQIDE